MNKQRLTRKIIFQAWEMSKKTPADWVKMDDLLDFLEDLEKEYENEHVNP
jgi:hypothetical protein